MTIIIAHKPINRSDTIGVMWNHITVSYTHLDVYKRQTIDRMASEHGQTEICSFLLQVEEQVAASSGHSPAQFCKNPVVNALIEYCLLYTSRCV